mgnify:CR=1 FL=1|jgi:hypothetical protein
MKQNEKKIEKLLNQVKDKDRKVKDFSDLLEGLGSTDEKKKSLWREIYENAVADRERASILFTEAYKAMGTGATDHISIGTTMSKYLERMSKSNDQILSLADLINKASEQEEKIVPDDLYKEILDS